MNVTVERLTFRTVAAPGSNPGPVMCCPEVFVAVVSATDSDS